MSNRELLKAICDALIAAVGVMKNRLDDHDACVAGKAHDLKKSGVSIRVPSSKEGKQP